MPSKVVRKGRGRILLVDDEPSITASTSQILSTLGYEVTAMTSSIAALERFRRSPDSFDLVLTDMTMPQMTGLDLARAILEIRREIPVVLLTGFSASLTQESIRTVGIHGVLMKPLLTSELASAVAGLLSSDHVPA